MEAETGLERARQNVWAVSEQAHEQHCPTSTLECRRGGKTMLNAMCDTSKLFPIKQLHGVHLSGAPLRQGAQGCGCMKEST